MPEDIADPIVEFTAQGLGKHPAKHLRRSLVAVDLSFCKSYLVEEIRDEARAEARVEAEARRAAEDVLAVLAERGIDVPEDARERITGCDDPQTLSLWLRRAVTAPKVEETFE
ncbi:hypothetical protein [Streptomyces sp. NPDC057238]|uniref:hypothetical protein n=1 Tax=Streptomyces sp. NPDC057238 TaxID=3346060 RepID=UPI0036357F01